MKMTPLQNAILVFAVVGLTACSSVNNDGLTENNIQTNAAVYSCNGKPLSVLFHAEQAQVTWEGKEYLLNHIVSASGSSYLADDASFWVHQKEAKLILEDMDVIQCDLVRIDA